MFDIRDVAQLGSALRWGCSGRRFKSDHPDQHVRISQGSDFPSLNKVTYLTFIPNCRSDYLVAYP